MHRECHLIDYSLNFLRELRYLLPTQLRQLKMISIVIDTIDLLLSLQKKGSLVKHSSRETGSQSAVSGLQVLLAIPLGTIGPNPQGRLAVVPTSTSGQK